MADKQYTIDVLRKGSDGTLTFNDGSVSVSTTCWWDPDVIIDSGTYVGYATRMSNKNDGTDGGKREAIWLGKQVPYNSNTAKADGFFIHKGNNASWSDGCIVAAASQVYKIWTTIHPKETANIQVVVRDEQVMHGCRLTAWW